MESAKKTKRLWAKTVHKTLYSTGRILSKTKQIKNVNVKAGWKKVASETQKVLGQTVSGVGKVGSNIKSGLGYIGESFQAGYRSVRSEESPDVSMETPMVSPPQKTLTEPAVKKMKRAENTQRSRPIPTKPQSEKKAGELAIEDLEKEIEKIVSEIDRI